MGRASPDPAIQHSADSPATRPPELTREVSDGVARPEPVVSCGGSIVVVLDDDLVWVAANGEIHRRRLPARTDAHLREALGSHPEAVVEVDGPAFVEGLLCVRGTTVAVRHFYYRNLTELVFVEGADGPLRRVTFVASQEGHHGHFAVALAGTTFVLTGLVPLHQEHALSPIVAYSDGWHALDAASVLRPPADVASPRLHVMWVCDERAERCRGDGFVASAATAHVQRDAVAWVVEPGVSPDGRDASAPFVAWFRLATPDAVAIRLGGEVFPDSAPVLRDGRLEIPTRRDDGLALSFFELPSSGEAARTVTATESPTTVSWTELSAVASSGAEWLVASGAGTERARVTSVRVGSAAPPSVEVPHRVERILARPEDALLFGRSGGALHLSRVSIARDSMSGEGDVSLEVSPPVVIEAGGLGVRTWDGVLAVPLATSEHDGFAWLDRDLVQIGASEHPARRPCRALPAWSLARGRELISYGSGLLVRQRPDAAPEHSRIPCGE